MGFSCFTGCILIDNHSIQDVKLTSLRRHVGLVCQDIVSDLYLYRLVSLFLFFHKRNNKISLQGLKHKIFLLLLCL